MASAIFLQLSATSYLNFFFFLYHWFEERGRRRMSHHLSTSYFFALKNYLLSATGVVGGGHFRISDSD